MANTARTISENRFGVELDGIPAFRCTNVTGGGETHEAVETRESNNPYPILGRGNFTAEDVEITIPSGKYDTAIEAIQQWIDNFADGIDTNYRSGRIIQYDDDGRTPLETRELRDCVPVSCKPSDKSADGNGTATFAVTIKPTKVRRV
jgi:hypothetical protein